MLSERAGTLLHADKDHRDEGITVRLGFIFLFTPVIRREGEGVSLGLKYINIKVFTGIDLTPCRGKNRPSPALVLVLAVFTEPEAQNVLKFSHLRTSEDLWC